MQDSSTNAEGFHLVGLYCVALRKWQFRYAVSFGEASASESQLQCSSVAQSKAEHVETAVPGSTGRPFRILSNCQILGVFWETPHSRGSYDAGACGSGLSRGDLSGGELDSDAAQSPRPGSNIISNQI